MTGLSATASLLNLSWSWRSDKRQTWIRLLPILTIVTLITVASIVAGIFSSEISNSPGDEILVASLHCGVPNFSPLDTSFGDYLLFQSHITKRMHAFRNYGQDCYTRLSNSPTCKTMVRSSLSRTVTRNASCPFDKGLCMMTNGNIKIDTGLLDSHYDIGLNAPPSMRIQFRLVIHCVPLVTQDYTENLSGSTGSIMLPYRMYFYGPAKGHPSNVKSDL